MPVNLHAGLWSSRGAYLGRQLSPGKSAAALVADWSVHGFEVPGRRREAVYGQIPETFR